ncbi:MAG: hypothetical protein ABIJ42_03765 [Acidobacteriota bacterium]
MAKKEKADLRHTLKACFLSGEVGSLPDADLLELLLFFANASMDT